MGGREKRVKGIYIREEAKGKSYFTTLLLYGRERHINQNKGGVEVEAKRNSNQRKKHYKSDH